MGNEGLLRGGTADSSFSVQTSDPGYVNGVPYLVPDARVEDWQVGTEVRGIIVASSDQHSPIAWADMRLDSIIAVPEPSVMPLLCITINLTIFPQSTGNYNGAVTTTAPPKPLTYAMKDILNVLAFDENIAGNWPSNSFPKTAKLAVAGNNFIVVIGTNVLLNVSDIMSLSLWRE